MKRSIFALLAAGALSATPAIAQNTGSQPQSQTAAPANEAKVELIDAGSGEKREVRYQFKEGQQQRSRMTQKMEQTMSMGGQAMPSMPMPSVIYTTSSKVMGQTEQGHRVESTIENIDVEGQDMNAQMMRQQLQAQAGETTTTVITNRGQTVDQGEQGMSASPIEDMQSGNAVVFPAEAIGTGASWKVTQRFDQDGLVMDMVTTYKLVEIDGSMVTLEIDGGAEVKDATLSQQGMEIQVDSMSLKTNGTVTIDLTKPSPVKGNSTMNMNMEASIDPGQGMGPQKISQEMKMTVVIEPATAAE